MNLLHMKYAVEIAETNSINKAADKLYVGQSALSRAIKELEASIGVTLFERSAKGMFLTPDGEIFIRYAKNILKQQNKVLTSFSVTMPGNTEIRASKRIYFNRPEAHVKGWYKVKSCTHSVAGGIYTVNDAGKAEYLTSYWMAVAPCGIAAAVQVLLNVCGLRSVEK